MVQVSSSCFSFNHLLSWVTVYTTIVQVLNYSPWPYLALKQEQGNWLEITVKLIPEQCIISVNIDFRQIINYLICFFPAIILRSTKPAKPYKTNCSSEWEIQQGNQLTKSVFSYKNVRLQYWMGSILRDWTFNIKKSFSCT